MNRRKQREDDAVDYPQFRKTAESLCAEDREKERIEKEFALIEKRNWEKYMALFAGILGKVRSPGRRISSGGSIRHSYALMKVVEPGRDISCRLGMKNQKDDFFTSNLEYFTFLSWKFPFGRYLRFRKIRRMIIDSVYSSGLTVRTEVRKNGRDRRELNLSWSPSLPYPMRIFPYVEAV